MLVTLLRAGIMYVIVISSVRIMGKRQIGQLQPTELAITLLLSEIAAIPIENTDIPLIALISAVFLLVALEIFVSYLNMKLPLFRKVLQGNSALIIENGIINQDRLKTLRLTIDDLTEALRVKDVFDLSEVSYAYLETTGEISVELKSENKPATAGQLNVAEKESEIPFVIISDGRTITENFSSCNMTEDRLEAILKGRKISRKDVLVLTADSQKVCTLVKKEDCK